MFRHSKEKAAAKEQALIKGHARIKERPDLYRSLEQKNQMGKKLGQDFHMSVLDLHAEVPELDNRQIASLLGTNPVSVRNIIMQSVADETDEPDPCSPEANEAASAASLLALQAAHPNGPGEDDPRAETEFGKRGFMVVRSTPNLDPTASYRVDQSDSLPRPITLPTTPFAIAA